MTLYVGTKWVWCFIIGTSLETSLKQGALVYEHTGLIGFPPLGILIYLPKIRCIFHKLTEMYTIFTYIGKFIRYTMYMPTVDSYHTRPSKEGVVTATIFKRNLNQDR